MATRRPTTPPHTPAAVPLPPATDPTSPSVDSVTAASPVKKASTVRRPRVKQSSTLQQTVPLSAVISEDVRRGMIAEAAYLRAERRGFCGGHEREQEDWLAAEAEVDALLKAGHGTAAQ